MVPWQLVKWCHGSWHACHGVPHTHTRASYFEVTGSAWLTGWNRTSKILPLLHIPWTQSCPPPPRCESKVGSWLNGHELHAGVCLCSGDVTWRALFTHTTHTCIQKCDALCRESYGPAMVDISTMPSMIMGVGLHMTVAMPVPTSLIPGHSALMREDRGACGLCNLRFAGCCVLHVAATVLQRWLARTRRPSQEARLHGRRAQHPLW